MNKISRLLILGLVTLVWSVAPSLAQKRIALVIGNSKYSKLQSLPNPGNDSQLMAKTLRKLNFDVVTATDADFLGMRRAVSKFGRKLSASGKDAVGLFYYAGHGVQAQGSNYLIPLGAEIYGAADLDIETLAASDVLAQMEAAGNTLNMVILDACRNNPFKGKMRSSSRGLARVNAASGSLVAFAAAPGQAAADGNSENSPYTSALVEAMQVPGLSVEQMFKRVRISVETQTDNQQTPWEESSLRGDFFFTPKAPEPKFVARPKVDAAEKEWATIQNTQSTSVLKAFIKRHPDSVYADYARFTLEDRITADEKARIEKKQKQVSPGALEVAFWTSIQSRNNPALFEDYLSRFPKGNFAIIANERLNALKKIADQKNISQRKKMEEEKTVNKQEKEIEIASLPENSNVTLGHPEVLDSEALTFLLQKELARVGCEPGRIDGKWGSKGRQALAQFKKYSNLTLDQKDISPEVVEAVKKQRSRVCPKSAPVLVRKAKTVEKPTRRKAQKSTNEIYFRDPRYANEYKSWGECVAAATFGHNCVKFSR